MGINKRFFGYVLFAVVFMQMAHTTEARAQFDLTFEFSGGTSSFSAVQLALFDQVEAAYEDLIVGYRPGVVGLAGATIDVSAIPIDGLGRSAGQGGGFVSADGMIGGFQFFDPNAAGDRTTGFLELDVVDLPALDNIDFSTLVFHETAHALGFGALWRDNNAVTSDGQYIGEFGLAAYQIEFDLLANVVPTDGFSPETAGHWNEASMLGNDILSPQLSSGVINPLSETTRQSFRDLGYRISAIPEPASGGVLVVGGLLLILRRRK